MRTMNGIGRGIARMIALASLASMALIAARVHADGDYSSPTDERVRVSLGAMHVSSSTRVRADSSSGRAGTEIDGERDFGLDKSNFEPKFEATVHVATRHRLTFDYFNLDRNGSATVAGRPLVFRDVVLQATDPLRTNLSLRTFGIAYGYSFWHSEKLEIAATLGVQTTDLSTTARVQTPTRHIIQREDAAGPIPVAGIDGTWVLSKRFYVGWRAQYLKVHVHTFDGSLGLYDLEGLYRFRPNVSLGLGYIEVRARLESLKTAQTGRFDFNSKGPEMFVRVAF